MKATLTDLHTHILPSFDDGAQSLEMAQQMLRTQKAGGVDRVALTPHFYPMREDLDAFVQRRKAAIAVLQAGWDVDTMPQVKLGAEVRFSTQLTQMDLRKLTIGDSDYMLLELPDDIAPAYVEQVLQAIIQQGITPILAHVERCIYFRNTPDRLLKLIHIGALAQVSAEALMDRRDKKFALSCLRNGLAHVIASDAHNIQRGGICLQHLVADVQEDIVECAEAFARAIWNNECPPAFAISPVKKGLFGYSG